MPDIQKPTRAELSKIFTEQRTLLAIESLFDYLNELAILDIDISSVSGLALASENSGQISKILSDLKGVLSAGKTEQQFTMPYVNFTKYPRKSDSERSFRYDSSQGTLNFGMENGVVQHLGMNLYYRGVNETGSTLQQGVLVGFGGVSSTNQTIKIEKFIADGSVSPLYVLGVITYPGGVVNGETCYVTFFGHVHNLDTSAFSLGDLLYASPSTAGALTNIKPSPPDFSIPVAVVLKSHASEGEIFVRPTIEQPRYYGVFSKTTSASLSTINTAEPIFLDSKDIGTGIDLNPLSKDKIVFTNAGLYGVTATFQVTSSSSSPKNGYFWLSKNGVDLTNSTSLVTLVSNSEYKTLTRTWEVSLTHDDYISLNWAVDDLNLSLSSVSATGFSPAAPSVIVSISMLQN